MPVALHVGNRNVIDITFNMFKMQTKENAFYQGNVSRLFAVFLTVHNTNNDIDLYMIFWFYFTCIKISPRQTISSLSALLFSSVYFEPDVC